MGCKYVRHKCLKVTTALRQRPHDVVILRHLRHSGLRPMLGPRRWKSRQCAALAYRRAPMFFSIARRTALLALAIVANSALANPGDPDPTFAAGGISQVGSGFERDFPVALVQQADGKLIEFRSSSRNPQFFLDMPIGNG